MRRIEASWAAILAVSLASYLFLALNWSGLYWDDWPVVLGDYRAVYTQSGKPWMILPFETLLGIHPGALRFAVFLASVAAPLLFHGILRKLDRLDLGTNLVLALVFATFPVNFARISVSIFNYSVSMALFLAAYRILLSSQGIGPKRLAALGLFFASFTTNSFLFLFGVVMLERAYTASREVGWRIAASRCADLVVVALAFVLVQKIVWVPVEAYANYNKIDVGDAPGSALRAATIGLRHAFVQPIVASWSGIGLDVLPFAPLLLLPIPALAGDRRRAAKMIGFGWAVFFVGVLPYYLVGKRPSSEDWFSRHQLLVPFGAAFLSVGIASLLPRPAWSKALLKLAVVLFTYRNSQVYLQFIVDHWRQEALGRQLAASSAVQAHTTFVVTHEKTPSWALERSLRFYEYGGLLKRVFHDERRLMIRDLDLADAVSLPNLFTHQNLAADYKPRAAEIEVTLEDGDVPKIDHFAMIRYLLSEPPRDAIDRSLKMSLKPSVGARDYFAEGMP